MIDYFWYVLVRRETGAAEEQPG